MIIGSVAYGAGWAGVPVENLLSEPSIISGDKEYVNEGIDSLIRALLKEGLSKRECVDLKNLLFRREGFSHATNTALEERIQKARAKLYLQYHNK